MKKIAENVVYIVLMGLLIVSASMLLITTTIKYFGYVPVQTQMREDLYALTTKVTSINEETDEVECEDFNGNIWVFKGVSDWCEGDIASLVMDSKGTKDIYDDEIVNARCSGYWEGWNK